MPNKPSHKSKNKKAGSHNKTRLTPTSTPPKNEEFSQEFTGKLNNNASSQNNNKKSNNSSTKGNSNGRDEFSKELTDIIKKNLDGSGPNKRNKNKK